MRYVNLDYAASTPALHEVWEAVQAFMPWYSSVHRGAGFKSQVATAAFEGARESVRRFVHARDDDAVIFTRNATDAMNLLSSALGRDATVISTAVEHHANMLPWRRSGVRYLPVPDTPGVLLDALESTLRGIEGEQTLVAMTGASNVTGELWPIGEIVRIAHAYGARVLVDAAQLAPHVPIDMTGLDIDYLAFSGHKLYAPFGAGVLIGRPDWLAAETPFLMGGGAVEFVSLESVMWAGLPDRQEAGSPNVVGAVALGVACATLQAAGMKHLAAVEEELYHRARARLASVPGLESYTLWDGSCERIGVLLFNLAGYPYGELAAILSAEYGIGVRHGCFCAHPLMLHLLKVEASQADAIRDDIQRGHRSRVPGAVRMSLGIGTTIEDIDRAADALMEIATRGPTLRYRACAGEYDYEPESDARSFPALPFGLARTYSMGTESS